MAAKETHLKGTDYCSEIENIVLVTLGAYATEDKEQTPQDGSTAKPQSNRVIEVHHNNFSNILDYPAAMARPSRRTQIAENPLLSPKIMTAPTIERV